MACVTCKFRLVCSCSIWMRCRSTREARKIEHKKAAQHTKNMNSTAAGFAPDKRLV